MRLRHSVLFAITVLLASGCHKKDTTEPSSYDEGLSLVPDFVQTMATSFDTRGIGGAMLPDNLALSTEQKAAITALHEAFRAATAAAVAALQNLEADATA